MVYTVTIHRDGAHFWSEVPALPGCFASARTLSELHEALGEAIGLYLWDEPALLGPGELAVGRGEIEVSRVPSR